MPITDRELKKQINRLVELCKFVSKSEDSLPVRTDEYTRILRAGLRDDSGLSVVVDDLIEHCEEIPAPAEMMAAIARYNSERLQVQSTEKALAERNEWPKIYGPAVPFEQGDGCCDCGMPWKRILSEAKEKSDAIAKFVRQGKCEGHTRRTFRPYANSWFEETESDYALAKRLLGIRSHRETCNPESMRASR